MIHRRFFVPKANIEGDQARITDEGDINHIRSVLRLNKGDEIILLDGDGSEYKAILWSLTGKEVQLKLTVPPIIHPGPKIELTLVQGLPKNPKMDFVIQKATELGISRIIPVITSRSVPIVKNIRRLIRWQRISREAASQSARVYLPVIERPMTFSEFLNDYSANKNSVSIVLWEDENRLRLRDGLSQLTNPHPRGVDWDENRLEELAVFVGPEGGFTEEEVRRLKDHGAITCSLGRQLLRTETASIIALAIILYELGELG